MSVSKDPNGLWCVILAAGASTRLGKPKQLVRYRSRPLLLHAAHAATSMSPNHTIVVLGAHSLRLRALIARHLESVSVVVNPRWQSGMTSSLITGLSALPSNARAALLVLSDQPRVGPQSLRRLVKAWRTKPSAPAAAYFSDTMRWPSRKGRKLLTRLVHVSISLRRTVCIELGFWELEIAPCGWALLPAIGLLLSMPVAISLTS